MRPIKFKLWDDKLKKMGNPFSLDGRTKVIGFIPDKDDLLQFTGLLDKNGMEIYEGDYILASNEWQLKRYVGVQEVFYNSKLAKFDFKNRKGIYLNNNILQHPQTRLEVVGNIYENPDLLADQPPEEKE